MEPHPERLQELINTINHTSDLRQPLDLERQLLETSLNDIEVAQSMVTMLAVSTLAWPNWKEVTVPRPDMSEAYACYSIHHTLRHNASERVGP